MRHPCYGPGPPSSLMQQPSSSSDAPSRLPALVACAAFFASGAAGLAFETLWFHQAGLVFGNSVWASSLVLGGFMAGMAFGNLLAARRRDPARRGLRLYAGLELAIAVSGVGLVYLLPPCSAWIAPWLATMGEGTLAPQALRLLLSFALLLVPSTAMGMTLPLLVAALRAWDGNFGRSLGVLYGANTAGAVAGVLGVEFLLLPALGIRASSWAAAVCNVFAAALMWLLLSRLPQVSDGVAEASAADESTPQAEPGSAAERKGSRAPWLLAGFGSGFLLLALEVVWLRFAMLFLNDTPGAFAVMLAVVLSGIALGGFVAAGWMSGHRNAPDLAPLLAYATGGLGLCGYLVYPYFVGEHYVPDQGPGTVLMLFAPLALPASLASGVLFSLLGAGLSRLGDSDARATGALASANTLGAALGSACAGFVLLPGLGMERSLFGLFAAYIVLGLVLTLASALRTWVRAAAFAAFAAALALFPFGRMQSFYVHNSARHWMTRFDTFVGMREGLNATILHIVHAWNELTLFDQLATNSYSMTTNDYGSRRYMKLYALLPHAVHPRVERALLIGYGMGNTAQALVQQPDLGRLDVVDVSPDMLALSRTMRMRRGVHPLDDARVKVHIEDGRHFLQGTRERYDLITGEPPPPVITGVVNLYTREYFSLLRDRLRDGGMVTYWLPLMNLSAATAKSLIAGFCQAFDDCSLWHGLDRNFMLLGTRNAGAAGPVSAERFTRDFHDPVWTQELVDIGFEEPGQLGALFIGGADYLHELTANSPPITDDQPKRMHQAGTREERDALLWQWRDTNAARARFGESRLIAGLFPQAVRDQSVKMFDTQRLINDLVFPSLGGPTPARQTRVLHQVLHGTQLRFPTLLLLKSEPDVQRALREAKGDRPEWLRHRIAGMLADRDFEAALPLLERLPDDQLAMPDLREYVSFIVDRRRTQRQGAVPPTP